MPKPCQRDVCIFSCVATVLSGLSLGDIAGRKGGPKGSSGFFCLTRNTSWISGGKELEVPPP